MRIVLVEPNAWGYHKVKDPVLYQNLRTDATQFIPEEVYIAHRHDYETDEMASAVNREAKP